MKWSFNILFCVFISFFSSCFEVVEEVTYKNTESGTYTLTANCSQSKTRLNTLLELDTFMGADMPDKYDIRIFLDSIEQKIKSTAGISAVKKTIDFDNYIFTLSFNFNKTQSLNNALKNVAGFASKNDELSDYEMFTYTQNLFKRNEALAADKKEIPARYNDAINQISDATITSIYRFAIPVKSSSNRNAKISKSGKAVMQKQRIAEMIKNPKLFVNTLTF